MSGKNEIDVDTLRTWIGREVTNTDELSSQPIRGLAATLDQATVDLSSGSTLPMLGQWLYFVPQALQSNLSADGHPQHGPFMPPIPLPRRMWAGSEIVQHRSIYLGQSLSRTDTIQDVTLKHGRDGALIFVQVHQAFRQRGELVLEETQSIVFREASKRVAKSAQLPARKVLPIPQFQREMVPDTRMLFRYSALTFNAHRIHYDEPYARTVEHYPGLVVHGPLAAVLLLDLLHGVQPQKEIHKLSIRAVKPLFEGRPVQLCGAEDSKQPGTVQLWTVDADGEVTMRITAVYAC